MSLNRLISELEKHQHAPTELWDPPYCGEIPIYIASNGDWFYQGSQIKRQALVKLFASVLVVEDGDYFLVTPAEKVKITVEDTPFVIVDWQQREEEDQQFLLLTTNIGDTLVLSSEHPLTMEEGVPYIVMQRGLTARVHRNVFYQWVSFAQSRTVDGLEQWYLSSAGETFVLGNAE
ncbi:DUF1285 domain-containing protein [Idiomarina sp. HP20-50]|uniref:DUF1285 domain-containing protein n=1 Tax=Idiomarina sp. HP20-50 TaxID=3070813 RepID=UPI00294AF600|nr:DUF1285 domain-containing protein [Idiomarina sp. HP20-50]MDV6317322.1 DUF1285 domain-containing protein [Idiomarina sp. HP20-50]